MTVAPRQALPSAGTILILNGASSSGKTSIARAIQSMVVEPYHHLQLDAFRAMEPRGYWEGWKEQPSDTVALKLAALCRAMNAALAEYSRHGQNVVFDTELSNPDAWQYVVEDLVNLPVLMVGITCGVAVLAQRESERGDRNPGLAASQFDRVHKDKEYDLMVDTTASSTTHCATIVAEWLRQSPIPQAFRRMSATRAVA
jgi:chloramphenicol 3-O phosphotransferase